MSRALANGWAFPPDPEKGPPTRGRRISYWDLCRELRICSWYQWRGFSTPRSRWLRTSSTDLDDPGENQIKIICCLLDQEEEEHQKDRNTPSSQPGSRMSGVTPTITPIQPKSSCKDETKEHGKELTVWMPINGFKCNHTLSLLRTPKQRRNTAPGLDASAANFILKMPKEWWTAVATLWNEVIKTGKRSQGMAEKPCPLFSQKILRASCSFGDHNSLAHWRNLRSFKP